MSFRYTEPPNDFTMTFSSSFGSLISPTIRMLLRDPCEIKFPPESVMFSYFTAFWMSSKETWAAVILKMSTAISTSLSSTPKMSTFFTSAISSISS